MAKGIEIFRNVGVNITIAVMLFLVGMLAFDNSLKSVFVPSYENVYYNGDTAQNDVSLMINVYWGNEYIESMLDTLQKFEAKTTFFVGGVWVSKYPEIFNKIVNAGHEIGNHGFFHKDHSTLTFAQNQQEIMNTHNLVREYTKENMTLFAPPSGAFNENTVSAAKVLGYKVIMWTRDTIDWRDKDTNLIINRATKGMSGGDFILMHPTLNTMQALPQILEYCKNNNFDVVPVSKNMAI